MKTRVLSVLLVLVLTATMLVSFGTVASAEEYVQETKPWTSGDVQSPVSGQIADMVAAPDRIGRWNGTTAEWYKQEGEDIYEIRFIRWSPYKWQWHGEGYMLIKLSDNDAEIINSSDGATEFRVSYDAASGLIRADLSEFVEFDPNCDYNFTIYFSDLKNTYFKRIFRSEDVNGNTLRQGYDSGFYELKGTAYISGIVVGGKEVTANLIDHSSRTVPEANLRYQWEKSRANAHMWENISGATKQTYTPTTNDIGSDLRVRISAKDYFNYAVSTEARVGKMPTDQKPVAPTLAYKNGSIVVTNAKADQEYIIANKLLSKLELEERWPAYNALETGKEGEFIQYGSESGETNYVYTRIRETQTTLPGDDVAWASAYCGETTLKLKCRTYDPEDGYEISMLENRDNGELVAFEKFILRLSVESAENDKSFTGVLGKNFTCNKKDGTAYPVTFYQDKTCTTPVSPYDAYKDVYVKLPEVTNGLIFTAKDDFSEAQIVLNVGYSDRGSLKVALDSVTVPDITVTQGTASSDTMIAIDPDSAVTVGRLQIVSVSDGNKPVAEVVSSRKLKVDATKADPGNYVYEVKYIDRNDGEQSMGYFKVIVEESTIVPEALTLSANAIRLPVGDFHRLEALLSPAGAVGTITWTTSDSSVAVVDNGAVVAKSLTPGDTCVITATLGDLTDTCTVTITEKEASGEGQNPFADVTEEDEYFDAVVWAYNHEPQITNGKDATHFAPKDTVKRGEAVTFLWRVMGTPEPKSMNTPFVDLDQDYYKKAVAWATEQGIVKGKDATHFCPEDTLTTAHMVTFLYRTVNPGEDGWYEGAAAWAKDNGLLSQVGIVVNDATDCPRGKVVMLLYYMK